MSREKAMSRRQFLRSATVGAGTLVMAACGVAPQAAAPTTAPAVAPTAAALPTTAAAPETAAFTLGVTPGSPNHARGWTTLLPAKPEGAPFNPPLTITSSRRLGNTRFYNNDSIENSPFTRFVQQELGIQWQPAFTWSDGPEGEQKLNLAIASGDLPDLMETVPLSIFASMLEADLVEDITDVYERVADPIWVKEPLARDNNAAWKYAQVNGRRMGMPYVETAAQNDKLLWIRRDWLEQVNLAPPTTLDELAAVALAFKQNELGQGDAGTTVGLGANKHLNGWYGSLDPVFGAFGVLASPGDGSISDPWTQDGDTLVYDPTRPQMKEALGLLRQWYADGVLARDFFTIAEGDVANLVGGNRCGLHFSPSFGATYGPTDSLKNDPSAEWMFADIPAGPGGTKGKAAADAARPMVFVFRKGTPHVEAVLKQTNWLAQLKEDPANLLYGWEAYNYVWNGDQVALQDSGLFHPWFYGPVGTAGNGGMDALREYNAFKALEELSQLPKDQLNAYQELMLEDPTGLQTMRRQAYTFAVEQSAAQGLRNLFTGLPTPTMQEQGAQITALLQETFIGIITGDLPLNAFDEAVTRWKDQGGDRITAEVNEWWAANRA